jgi:hypothetical protein
VATGQRLSAGRRRASLPELPLRAARNPALAIFAWSRAAIWLAALFAFLWFEPNRNPRAGIWDGPELHDLGWVTDVWARWDSLFFVRIAQHGYDASSAAFFPLYPLLVGGLGRILGGHYVLAGILVSLAACAVSFVLLYRLAEPRLGADGARRAVLYLALFPMALFLQAVYSESLFLALALAAFLLAERGRFAWAGTAAGLALLTRSIGVALLTGLAILAWRSRNRARAFAGLAIAPALFAAFPLYLWWKLGDAWAFLHAQDAWHRHFVPLGGIPLGLKAGGIALWHIATSSDPRVYAPGPDGINPLHRYAEDLEHVVFLLLFAWLAVVAWRRFGAPLGAFAVVGLAIPLSYPSSHWPLLSLPRFGLVLFPLFLALAAIGGRPRVHSVVVAVSSLFLGVCVVQWALWQWVA